MKRKTLISSLFSLLLIMPVFSQGGRVHMSDNMEPGEEPSYVYTIFGILVLFGIIWLANKIYLLFKKN
jgi:hypothetical protein